MQAHVGVAAHSWGPTWLKDRGRRLCRDHLPAGDTRGMRAQGNTIMVATPMTRSSFCASRLHRVHFQVNSSLCQVSPLTTLHHSYRSLRDVLDSYPALWRAACGVAALTDCLVVQPPIACCYRSRHSVAYRHQSDQGSVVISARTVLPLERLAGATHTAFADTSCSSDPRDRIPGRWSCMHAKAVLHACFRTT